MTTRHFNYSAENFRVIDGDTVECDVDLGFKIKMRRTFRLAGINAPESKGATKRAGLLAKDHLTRLLSDLAPITLLSSKKKGKKGKYGRYVAGFWGVDSRAQSGTIDINRAMVVDGYAVYKEY